MSNYDFAAYGITKPLRRVTVGRCVKCERTGEPLDSDGRCPICKYEDD